MSAELPIAIVGIGCEFPGGSDTKDLYYEFLRNKGDGMAKPPPDRWDHAEWQGGNDEPGKYNSAMAGFIHSIDSFDPLEFGISMKEAQYMDPSLRLTLEVAHQALMDSGIDYRGSCTGVYFAQLLTSTGELADDRYDINNHHGFGRCIAFRANRVSFTFDLRGPSLAVDTACSSAATAMHIAISAIKLGDISQALIIGGNTVIHPQHMVTFSKLGILSPTGSSKSFDAAADGYARAEGFAAVVVKRLDKAVADGDHIYSVITGSSINSNGKGTSPGMPDGSMQAETILQAYSRAKRHPSEAFYVELHATGTSVGDPIEANAAGKVFSEGRDPEKPLRVGSVKSNIGHTEGCSFLASLIKVSLMLERKEIIPNIRYITPNPKINFAELLMSVQTKVEPLTPNFVAPDGKWVASVSCHGIGGSNAHVVLETVESTLVAAPPMEVAVDLGSVYLFMFAATTEPATLRWKDAVAEAYKDVVDNRILRSLSHDLARLSRPCPVRAFAIGPTISPELELSIPVTINPKVCPKLCLVFAGQGPQHISMGKTLALTYRAFLDSVKRSDDVLVGKYGKKSFLNYSGLFVPGEVATLPENGVWPVQDVVYSIVFTQMALVDLLKSFGIEYDYVVGHSLGEVAMGYASGHYSRETAIGMAIARAEAMKEADGNGCMAAVDVGVQKAKLMIKEVLCNARVADGLWIAAINSPDSVTVAGKHKLIDMLMDLATGLGNVFATKLRVTCAFHTPLMEPYEQLFKTGIESTFSSRTNVHVARVMSTVDGTWLERDFGIDYCWDNIHRPVLFGPAIHKIVKEHEDGGVLFMEISPHPVLKAYIEQCGGKPINLIRRPNPNSAAQTIGEHYQFLKGMGHLLTAGFKSIDLAKLCATSDGIQDFIKCKLPKYPLNRSPCWSESAAARSVRLQQRPRPLASSQFRLNVDTHPDLAGHVILGAQLFPASGYLESILENGAMIVKDIHFHLPLVLDAHGNSPAYVGCIIHHDKWEFRVSTTNAFDNGNIQLDTAYATGSFSLQNAQFDPSNPKLLDVGLILSLSQGSITGEEFYSALPSAYGYRDHFSRYVQEIHEVPDKSSWFGLAYLVKLEIPAGGDNFLERGYVIHPSILDSIIHCALAMFINMETKLSDFDGVFVPVNIDTVSRWDGETFLDPDPGLRGVIWSYLIARTFAPEGPLMFDYIVANSERQVLLSIEGFEATLMPHASPTPIGDISTAGPLTIIWQPKDFPSSNFALGSMVSRDPQSCLRNTFEALITNSQVAGRHVVRVLDLDQSMDIARALDALLVSFLSNKLLVEYFIAVATTENIDTKTRSLQHTHVRSFAVDAPGDNEGERSFLSSFDILLQTIELSRELSDLETFLRYLVPSGIILFLVSAKTSDMAIDQQCSLAALVQQLEALPNVEVSVADSNEGDALVLVRASPDYGGTEEFPVDDVVIHHFEHGNEGQLVKIAENLSTNSELWIVGDDDARSACALGIAACVAAESPDYTIRTLIFENHDICPEARTRIVHQLCQSPLLLEQHLKYTRNGKIFVRRLVYGSTDIKPTAAPGILACVSKGQVFQYFPPGIGPTDVQVSVNAIGIDAPLADQSLVAFVGKITHLGADVKHISVGNNVIGIANHSITDIVVVDRTSIVRLPDKLTREDAAALPITFLAAWFALVDTTRISDQSTVLLHDAGSLVGLGSVQICQRIGAKFFCAVATVADGIELSTRLNVDKKSIGVLLPGDDVKFTIQTWLETNHRPGFDVIFNPRGDSSSFTTGIDLLKPMGHYIHNQKRPSDPVNLPPGASTTHVINISKLVENYTVKIISSLSDLLIEHISAPFQLPLHTMSFSQLTSPGTALTSRSTSLIAIPERLRAVRIDPTGQLFDPCKTYLLLGGSSELGVHIIRWMVSHGACNFVLTSRRGPKALTKMDLMHIHNLQLAKVSVDVVAADARNRKEMVAVIGRANKVAPIGGIFLMTVVLRDATFSQLTQKSFDDVYQSKVQTLNTLLSCVNTADLGFLLLFSTIGSIFGNAGQAAYCASQSYLDRIAETLPNTISISLPPISDSGIFKRLVQSMKGRPHIDQLSKISISAAQTCNFIGDCLIRRISHYVPILAIERIPESFPTCEPLLYSHLLPNVEEAQTDVTTHTAETPTTLLAAIVGLHPEQISDNSVITSFGLDSLGAVHFSNDLKKHFDIKISQIELLGSTTIRLLNETLRKMGTALIGASSGAHKDDGTAVYGAPLTAILNECLVYADSYTTDATPHQYRLWLAQAEFDSAGEGIANQFDYHKSQHGTTQWSTHEGYFVVIASSTPLNINRMRHTIEEIVQRHGALRTAFSWSEEGKLKQTIYSTVDFETDIVDLRYHVDARQKAYEISLAAHKEPHFQLDRLPLLILTIFNLGAGEWGFNIVFHHIIMDEHSLGIIFYELFTLYLMKVESLPPPRLHYSDFSEWLSRTSDRRIQLRNEQIKFWTENLKDIQPLRLSLVTPTEELLSPITHIEAVMNVRTLQQYHALIVEAGVTPFTGFLAAYNVLLFKCSSQALFAVGTTVTQRNVADLANVVGFFANTLPIKTNIDPSHPFSQYLTAFKADLTKSLQNGDVSYEEIGLQGQNPLPSGGYFRHLFTFGGLSLDAFEELDGIQVKTIIRLPNVGDQHEFHLTVHETGRVALQFDNHLFSEEMARQFLDGYITLIKNLGRDPHIKIRDISATNVEHDCLGIRLSRVGEGAQEKVFVKRV